jgi:hypothetical protein
MSGPLEREFMSGPLENIDRSHFSAPLGGLSDATNHHMAYFRKRKRYFSRFVRTVRRSLGKVLHAVLQLVVLQQDKDYDKYGPAEGAPASMIHVCFLVTLLKIMSIAIIMCSEHRAMLVRIEFM